MSENLKPTPGEAAFNYVHCGALGRGGFCIWANRSKQDRDEWEALAQASIDAHIRAPDPIHEAAKEMEKALKVSEIGLIHCIPTIGYNPETLHIARAALFAYKAATKEKA